MKQLTTLLVLLCTLIPLLSHGQSKPNYVGQWYQSIAQGKSPQNISAFSRSRSDFARTKRYNLEANMNQLNSIMNTKPSVVNLVVPYGDSTYTLNFAKVQVASPDFTVTTPQGDKREDTGVQYRGIVNGNPSHVASMNLTKTDKSIYFSTNTGNFVIAKEGVEFIAYRAQDMTPPVQLFCETPDAVVQMPIQNRSSSAAGCKTVNVYFECDYAFYQAKGSNVGTLTDYVMGFFNQVATLYANEDISIQVSQIYTWTTPDPYVSLTTPSAIMNQFKTNRGTNFNGNLAHFLTTRDITGGGIAYVDVICNKAFAYGCSRVYTTFSNVPTYSWTVNVVTHELGHNLGSPHTHACSWSGGPIDNCYAVEGTCAPGPPPVNGGTIMSYCHLIAAGINFNNGFGPQPGNLIRAKIAAATCLTTGSASTPPTSLSTTNITSNGATLSWAAVSGTTSYTAQYKLATATTWITAGSTGSTSINLSGLTAGSNYVWSVKADCSAFSTNASFTTTGSTGCAAPTGLASASITQNDATLSWTAVSGATGYTVQYKTSAASTWTSVNASIPSAMITGLSGGTTYNWQVKANCSSYSTQASFTTTSGSGCAAPTGQASSNIAATTVTLSWGSVVGATGYTVQIRPTSSSTWSTLNVTLTSVNVTGLTAGTNYTWQVKANCSAYSPTTSFTTTSSSGGCTVPTGMTTSNISQTGATVSWTAVSGATSYTVQYKTATASTWITASSSSSTSKILSGLLAGTNYVWKVKTNCSAYTVETSFTTTSSSGGGCTVPTGLSTTNISQTGATVSWQAVTGATSYTVQYKTATATTWITLSASSGTSKVISGLTASTNYVWKVKTNCSAYSGQINFSTTSSSAGCATPTNMNQSNITSTSATLTWTGPSNALNYNIRYRLVGASGWTYINNVTGNSRVINNLLTKRNYEWSISTKCTNGMTSQISASKQFTTL